MEVLQLFELHIITKQIKLESSDESRIPADVWRLQYLTDWKEMTLYILLTYGWLIISKNHPFI